MIIMPSSTINPRVVDDAFLTEFLTAKDIGIDVVLLDSEKLDDRGPSIAVESLAISGASLLVYRGWMLKHELYSELYSSLVGRGCALINSPPQYRATHLAPNWIDAVGKHSPQSIVIPNPALTIEIATRTIEETFKSSAVVIKDYVKSQKHYWLDACFIKDASDVENVSRVIKRFMELQDNVLEGGLVVRRYIDLNDAPEIRSFILDGKVLYATQELSSNAMDIIRDVTRSINSRFYSIDIAETRDGSAIIIDMGDGQVTGITNEHIQGFYESLKCNLT